MKIKNKKQPVNRRPPHQKRSMFIEIKLLVENRVAEQCNLPHCNFQKGNALVAFTSFRLSSAFDICLTVGCSNHFCLPKTVFVFVQLRRFSCVTRSTYKFFPRVVLILNYFLPQTIICYNFEYNKTIPEASQGSILKKGIEFKHFLVKIYMYMDPIVFE